MMMFVKYYIGNVKKNESISVTEFLCYFIDRTQTFAIEWETWNEPNANKVGLIEITITSERMTMVGSELALGMVMRYLGSLRHLKSAQQMTPAGPMFTQGHRRMVLEHAICTTDNTMEEKDIWNYRTKDLLEVWRRMIERKVSFKDAANTS